MEKTAIDAEAAISETYRQVETEDGQHFLFLLNSL